MRTLKLLAVGLFLSAAGAVALSGSEARALSRGPFLEHANAPGEANCTECHRTYPLDSGRGRVEILDLPAQYTPSQVYPVRVRVSDPLAIEWGFEITAVTDSGAACGFFQSQDLGVQALGPSQRFGRFYAEQTILGVYAGQTGAAEWHFLWKAPSSDLGPANFYACGNAANGDHTDFFDYIYTTSVTIDGQTRITRVTLVTPAGGERLGSGEPADIRWEATPGDAAPPASFRIELSTDGGATFATRIAEGLSPDARAYTWQVPDALATTEARIRVVAVDTEGGEHAAASRSNVTIAPLGLDRAASVAIPAGALARRAAWADVDGDGLADAAVARSAGGVLLLRRTAAGGFEDATGAAGLTGAGEVRAVAWGDLDADGRPDLAVVAPSSISIFRNEGAGHFAIVGAPTSLPRPTDPRAAAWTDVDGDGRADLLVADASGLVALVSTGGGVADATALWGAPSGEVTSVAPGPVLALGGPSGVRVFRFEGGRLWDETAESGLAVEVAVTALAWGDVTGDGTTDLVAATAGGVRVFAGEGGDGARFVDRTAELGLGAFAGAAADVAAGDFDADGRLDLFAVVGGHARVARNRGDAGFLDATSAFSFDATAASGAWVDLDGSGADDLVAIAPTSATVFTNPRSGASAVRVRLGAGDAVAVDLDGDGVWATGPKTVRVATGAGLVLANAPGATSVRVRVAFAGAAGLETSAAVGGPGIAPERPASAPTVTGVRLAGAKLVVEGTGFASANAIEVAGERLERVKFKGTKLVGRDARLAALTAARPVAVRVVDPTTGALSAAVLLR